MGKFDPEPTPEAGQLKIRDAIGNVTLRPEISTSSIRWRV
jgi:hypothetical protein